MASSKTPNEQHKVVQIPLHKIMLKNLVMGGTAGLIGASSVYPLDMVKTRLQFQTNLPGGEKMYKNTLDCLLKIIKNEGFSGLYRGLPTQWVGIVPEKAIKLTVNDTIRFVFTDKSTGHIPLLAEIVAGCAAGFSQVVITAPYELVKVRLQTATSHEAKSAFTVIRELGLRGIFTGTGATLLRDVPFSAIYFASYGNIKRLLRDEKGHLSEARVFASGISAGVIAAAAATPMDVIKTRLQAKFTDGRKYKGIRDCFVQILRDEGPRAFFKGTIPRILIVSPLFGITLLVYEVLQDYFLPPEAKPELQAAKKSS